MWKQRWLGWLDFNVIGSVIIRQNACDFLFTFHRNYASILYHFQDTVSYLLKVTSIFYISTCIWCPQPVVTSLEFHEDVWHQKTRVPVHCLRDMFSHFDRTLFVTNTQTNRHTQTHGHSIYHASIASHRKNSNCHTLLVMVWQCFTLLHCQNNVSYKSTSSICVLYRTLRRYINTLLYYYFLTLGSIWSRGMSKN